MKSQYTEHDMGRAHRQGGSLQTARTGRREHAASWWRRVILRLQALRPRFDALAYIVRSRTIGLSAAQRYHAQARIVAAWIVRSVRCVLNRPLSEDLRAELDRFEGVLERSLFEELVRNEGYCPITNGLFYSTIPFYDRALREAGIPVEETILRALPHVRIRIVPGWVKVYGINAPKEAPIILYKPSCERA